MMVAFGIFDLITAMDGSPLEISDTIYTSFVVVTFCFNISEAGKAFGKINGRKERITPNRWQGW